MKIDKTLIQTSKIAIILSAITILSKMMGFVREIALSYFYGTSLIADAYIMGGNIVGVLFGWFSTIYLCFIPVYIEIKHKSGEETAGRFTGEVIGCFMTLSLLCVGLTYWKYNEIVRFIAPGFSEEAIILTGRFLKISVLILLVQPVIYPIKAYLECHSKFTQSNIPDVSVSVLQVIIIVASGLFAVDILPFAMFIPYLFQAIILCIISRHYGFKFRLSCRISDEMKLLFRMLLPYFVSSLAIEINSFVDRYFASSLDKGTVATLNYASVLNSFVLNVFNVALLTMIYPKLSKVSIDQNSGKFNEIVSKGFNIILVLFIPLTVGGLILAQEIVKCVYGRGAFGTQEVIYTTVIFRMYFVAILSLALRELFFRVLYSMQNTMTPLKIGIFSTGLNIILNIILIKKIGAVGIALATSISAIASMVPLFHLIIFRKKILKLKTHIGLGAKSAFSAFVMGIMILIIRGAISEHVPIIVSVLICTLSGVISYFGILGIIEMCCGKEKNGERDSC